MIYNRFYKSVKIDKQQIKKELMKNNEQNEYLLSEILFNLENDEKLIDKFKILKNEIAKKIFHKLL